MKTTRFYILALMMLCICFGCALDHDDDEPDAQMPTLTAISSDVTTTIHGDITLFVSVAVADGGTLRYQWYAANGKLDAGTALPEATAERFSPAVTEAGSCYYYCVVENQRGSSRRSVTSPRILVTITDSVSAATPVMLSQPLHCTAQFDAEFAFTVLAYAPDGGTLSYQWYRLADDDHDESASTAIDGATEASYRGTVTREALGSYYCVVTNTIADNGDGGTKTASTTTNRVTLSDHVIHANTPVITAQPVDTSAVIPAVRTFTVGAYTADDGALSYQWYRLASDERDDSDGTAIEGATEAQYRATAEEIGTVGYYCVITSAIEDNGDGGTKTASVRSDTAWFCAMYLKDAVPAPAFVTQPATLTVAPHKQSVTLTCEADSSAGYRLAYQWYESADGTTATGTAIDGANTAMLTTRVFTERGIHHYYCVATNLLPAGDGDVKSAAAISAVASVACTGLPTVYVTTPNGSAITSKTDWMENATISLVGNGNEDYNFDAVPTSIRGRGNSTWSQPKKPYALKLAEKQKIMGMSKHKRWVLIANYLDNSFMRNELAFYLSEQLALDWTVHGEFVDLVLNGDYHGLYWLGEAIKVDDKRVNIDEDDDYLIEMDVYYDETWKFKSPIRGLPYMVKNDDTMTDERLTALSDKITALEHLLYPDFADGMNTSACVAPDEAYQAIIDLDSWAKFWLVNEIMDNGELGHPKSCYFTFDNTNDVLKAGPVWDFDWASLSQQSAIRLQNTLYYNALFKSPSFIARLHELWNAHRSTIDLDAQIATLRETLAVAATFDTMRWGAHNDPSGISRADFDAYVDFLKETLAKKYAVVDSAVTAMP